MDDKIIYNCIRFIKIQMKKEPHSLQFASFDESKENGNQFDLTANQSVTSHPQINQIQHRKYGNMVVLFQNDRFLITLGPDYGCFIAAIICFILLYYLTISTLYQSQNKQILGLITIIGSVVQVLSYIIVAISNPGIITKADFQSEGDQQNQRIKRYCNICKLNMLPRARHCSVCGVCVKGYDHHCPWTSKCIGQHNLFRFYFFAAFTPLFLIFCVIMLSIASA